ncbi:MAG: phenylalanine--tRNA ligase subunit beta [Gammaproteobacteria bacterium]|nr:phenylalanine--tRNA ligase subunit beta [Gammaproteobacteria bacterium]
MKFSEQWLREWVNPAIDSDALAAQLTMAGLEVDGVEPAAAQFSGVVVGEVVSLEKHPEADKLNVCQVNVGEAENLTIVCGAANVHQGARVPCAKIGAVLPGDFKIKQAKLRGQPSFGMLCSAKELGLADTSDGLLLLPADAPIGMDFRQWLQLDDNIIEVDFTPNRGDCLSIAGMAREVGVLNQVVVNVPAVAPVAPAIDDTFGVELQAPADCPVYLGRVVRGVNAAVKTPMWMQERLRRGGQRSISFLVDVTNFVLLELGQPMHAFDLDKLSGKIVVRRASEGEKAKLLDDSEITLSSNELVIADAKGVVAFAGVMGGQDSSVSDDTHNLFLECAFFSPDSIRGKARKFGMQTDSSYRFERGVDFGLQKRAMERATQLILDIAGGQAGPVVERRSAEHLPVRAPISLRCERLKRVLGISLADATVADYLDRLGMGVQATAGGWTVTPPSYRFDIAIEADLIEEVGRIYGYNNIPTHTAVAALQMPPQPEGKVTLNRLRQLMVARGYNETISYSFVDETIQAKLDPQLTPLKLANPISSEMAVMRTTLWSSLIPAVEHNLAHQQNRVRLFETGMRYLPQADGSVVQQPMIAGVAFGSRYPDQWGGKPQSLDFYDIKSDVEAILSLTHEASAFIFKSAQHFALHPGQSAVIERAGRQAGWIGVLHPNHQQTLGLPGGIVLFELVLEEICGGKVPGFRSISKFPSLRRDLAVIVDEVVSAEQIAKAIQQVDDKTLKEWVIFDVYRGAGVPEGKKSLAIAFTIQDDEQTLIDSRVDALITTLLKQLKTVGATLRE